MPNPFDLGGRGGLSPAQHTWRGAMRTRFIMAASAALVTVLAWSPPVLAQQKTIKQCRDEWSANKVAIAASGKTQRVFVAECRGVPLVARTAPIAELAKGQYATEAEAKVSCRSDAVVWVNLRSKAYHDSGSKSYGATKTGAYMCEKESIAAVFHAAKSAKEAAKESARKPVKELAKPASS